MENGCLPGPQYVPCKSLTNYKRKNSGHRAEKPQIRITISTKGQADYIPEMVPWEEHNISQTAIQTTGLSLRLTAWKHQANKIGDRRAILAYRVFWGGGGGSCHPTTTRFRELTRNHRNGLELLTLLPPPSVSWGSVTCATLLYAASRRGVIL